MQICKRTPHAHWANRGVGRGRCCPGRAGPGFGAGGRLGFGFGFGAPLGWSGAERHGTACKESPWLPALLGPHSQSPPASPARTAGMRPRPFIPLVLPACGDLALLCLWSGLPSHSCFCTNNQQQTAFSVQGLQGAFCCSLEKSLPRPCFASTRGDTSLEKKLILWGLHLCS